MAEMVYFVQRDVVDWSVGHDAWTRWGFRSEAQAVRAATAAAQQLARSGHETMVVLKDPGGAMKALWRSAGAS